MLDHRLTHHAEVRMRQRGFRKPDVDLVLSVATRVADDTFFLTDQDAAREIQRRKREIQQLERLRGSKIIVEADAVITLYHAAPKLHRASGRKDRTWC
jgi:hypothetical protein